MSYDYRVVDRILSAYNEVNKWWSIKKTVFVDTIIAKTLHFETQNSFFLKNIQSRHFFNPLINFTLKFFSYLYQMIIGLTLYELWFGIQNLRNSCWTLDTKD